MCDALRAPLVDAATAADGGGVERAASAAAVLHDVLVRAGVDNFEELEAEAAAPLLQALGGLAALVGSARPPSTPRAG